MPDYPETRRPCISTQPLDPAKYKAGQRQEWDDAASGWRKWWEVIERGGQPASDRLVDLAEIRPGQRVLDIATGVGEPALTAARRVRPKGTVVGTDLSPSMLALAHERAQTMGLRNVEWRQMDAERLDFPASSFDAALCRWGLMFLPDLPGALGRIQGLLKPGGKFSAAVWSEPPKVPFISLAMGVIQRVLQPPPPPPGAPGPFSLAAPGILEQAFTKAGFGDVKAERLTVTWLFPSTQEYVNMLQDLAAPLRTLLAQHPAQRQREVWEGIAQAAQQYARPDASLQTTGETILVVGRR